MGGCWADREEEGVNEMGEGCYIFRLKDIRLEYDGHETATACVELKEPEMSCCILFCLLDE